MNLVLFDIETGPLPKEDIIDMLPPFNPDDVKLGNLKDEQKIAQKLADAERQHREKFFDDAALNAMTGQVLCIGVMVRDWNRPADELDEYRVIGDQGESEPEILNQFWSLVVSNVGVTNELVGFKIKDFDLGFLFKRSWKHGIVPPSSLRNGRYWNRQVIDLYEDWSFGEYRVKGTLDDISKFLGGPRKTGSGAFFSKLWESDRKAAIAYALRDLEVTKHLYDRMYKVEPTQWA